MVFLYVIMYKLLLFDLNIVHLVKINIMENKFVKIGNVEKGYGNKGVIFGNLDEGDYVMSISKEDDLFVVMEECDNWVRIIMTKEELLKSLDELKQWVKDK